MRPLLMSLGLMVAIAGCAKRVPEPIGVPRGVPHVTWIIMYGDRESPDAEFACQSTGPRECAIPASRPDAATFSDIHLYFHGAGNETTYVGSYRVEFFNDGGQTPRDSPIRMTVRGNEKIVNQSVTGIVTTMPGRYDLRLAVDATTATGSTPIRESVSVQVQ